MCGIIGILGSLNSYETILDGLKQLQNRGYDSAGIGLHNGRFVIEKFVSSDISAIDQMKKNIIKGDFISGVGHTRWATHGEINEKNCHPHLSSDENICLVHNGIIENYKYLKDFLISKGYIFYSDTDTEVICNLISYYREGNSMVSTLKKITNIMNGTWGIVVMEKNNEKIYFTRKGSPLLFGYSNDKSYGIITSEKSGFNNLVDEYISIENNDICYLEKEKGEVYFFSEKALLNFDSKYAEFNNNFHTNLEIDIENKVIEYDYSLNEEMKLHAQKIYKKINNINLNEDNTPGEFIYWTLKEIEEQKESSLRAINMGSRLKSGIQLGGLVNKKESLENLENLILLGCGTSFNAGLFASKYFKKHCNFNTIQVIDGADFNVDDIPRIGNSGCIFLSQSGETLDLIRCLEICKKNDVITIGIINVVDSTIARETDCGCYLNSGREVGVASTKAFTSQIIVLLLVCLWFHKLHHNKISKECIKITESLQKMSHNISYIIEKSRENMKLWSKEIVNEKSIFVLGKDDCYALSREAALKIKEISYIHAESSPASALKHGPFGLLEKNFPVILIDIGEKNRLKMINVYNEIRCRGAQIYTITDDINCKRENTFIIDTDSKLNNVLSIIPLQFLSFYLSITKKINPDYPRNLAKVVTVE